MKIAICVQKLTGGGAERVASLWCKGFYDLGYDVSLIINDYSSKRSYSIPNSVKVYCVGYEGSNRIIKYLHRKFLRQNKLETTLKSINPDVVITIMPTWIPMLIKARKTLKYRIISTEHSSFEHPQNARISKDLYYYKYEVNKLADLVTVLTQADKNCIGQKLDKVYVMPNPLTFEPVKDIPKKEKIILAVGRLKGWYVKGFDLLIKSWSLIYDKHPEWKIQIVGEGNTQSTKYLQDLINKYNLQESIQILPFHSDILPFYKKAEIFCMPSRYEGFGMVLVEAMSQGCACIACDYKGRQAEIITRDTEGILVQPDDEEELAKAINDLIINEAFRHQVQHEGVKRSAVYSLTNIMNNWERIFEYENIGSR